MLNPFKPLELVKAEVFSSMPGKFRKKSRTAWSDPNRQNVEVECFLEGPAFDRQGNLYIVDTPFGRIFRIDPKGEWELVIQYDGWPNGMKFHKDGRLFIADYRKGILVARREDARSSRRSSRPPTAKASRAATTCTSRARAISTSPTRARPASRIPTGRLFRLRANGSLDRLVTNIPSPNGVTVSTTEKHVYVGVTRSQQVWRLPVMHDLAFSKTGVAIQLSGGVGGPDGVEMDAENGILVCQLGVGVWRFDANMLPTHLIHSEGDKHHHLDNVAFGGPDRKTVYITDSLSGDVLMAKLPVAGKLLYGLHGACSSALRILFSAGRWPRRSDWPPPRVVENNMLVKVARAVEVSADGRVQPDGHLTGLVGVAADAPVDRLTEELPNLSRWMRPGWPSRRRLL